MYSSLTQFELTVIISENESNCNETFNTHAHFCDNIKNTLEVSIMPARSIGTWHCTFLTVIISSYTIIDYVNTLFFENSL